MRKELGAARSERVEDDLAVSSSARETGLAQYTDMVGDEILCATADPGEIAHTQLITECERVREREARWIGKRLRRTCSRLMFLVRAMESGAYGLRARQVEAQQIATVKRHINIITMIDVLDFERSLPVPAGERARSAGSSTHWTTECCMAHRAAAARVDVPILP